MAATSRSLTCRGCGLAKRMRSTPGISWTASSSPPKSHSSIVWRLVVIHDLPEQLHLAVAGLCGGTYFRQNLGLRAHAFLPSGVRHNAETAVLVAPFDDGYPRPDRVAASRHSEWKRHIVLSAQVYLHVTGVGSLFEQHRQQPHPARSNDNVDQPGALQKRCAFLLRHASRHGHYGIVARARGPTGGVRRGGYRACLRPAPSRCMC